MSDKPTHTPGPWRADADLVVGGPDAARTVAVVGDPADEVTPTDRANCRLIVAAPGLLAELLETADWLEAQAEALRSAAEGLRVDRSGRVQAVRTVAARLRGRAVLLRQAARRAAEG